MFLELYWCEHQLCGFAIQLQLFWESLNWLPGCPTNICTGCVLKCFGRWYLRNGALNSDSWYVYHIVGNACMQIYLYNLHKQLNNTSLLLVCVDIMHHQDKKIVLLLPLLWLTSCWPSAGWTAAPDWLGSRKGTSECQGNTGTDRGSTLVQTVGTGREGERVRQRKKSETSSNQSIWVSWTANRR